MKCKLRIHSMHDLEASCACGHWYMIGTGEGKMADVRREFRSHKKGVNRVYKDKAS